MSTHNGEITATEADFDLMEQANAQASDEQDWVEQDPAYWEHYGFSDVEQGMYDDDPSPYHGDYSEM